MVTEEGNIAEEGRTVHGGRILVVDDNEMNRNMLSRRLLRRGYDVEIAEDGRRAIEMIGDGDFDLVLLDVMMPEMNGYEVLERLQSDDRWRHVPVIMISALDEMESVVRCIKLGAADYLPKPFNVTLLGARVEACLARKRLHDREALYAASMARELEIGRQIQRGFLPATLPAAPGWELAASFLPARQVAGDFYDAFEIGDSGHIGLVMADVCDKGVGAALFMALFRSLLRAFSEQGVAVRDTVVRRPQLLDTMRATNDYIARTHDRANMFATVFFGVLEPASGVLRYVNAGHDAPVVATSRGLQRLEPTGPALGLLPDMHFEVRETRLEAGALLVAFTDGVTDAQDAEGRVFTEERLLDLLTSAPASAADVVATIEEALETFTAGAVPFDDCTLLAVRRDDRE
jgi:phosphoserine phosphatase RsbU/P